MGLRKKEEGCQYLREDEQCDIYQHRPVTCRRYPFDVEFGDSGEISLLEISDAVECPYELDGYQTLGEIKAMCTWEEEEENPYYAKLQLWNRRKRSGGKKAFLAFLGF